MRVKLALSARPWGILLGLALPLFGGAAADPPPPPVVDVTVPEPGAVVRELYTVEVQFSVPVTGVEAEDLSINQVPATNVVEVAEAVFLFSFPLPAEGDVRVGWRADHGIASRDDPAQPFAGGEWQYVLRFGNPTGLIISEFMADNRRTLNDQDGDSSDWIELFNPDEDAVELGGWFLTDSRDVPARWRFPEVAIPGRGYLVVFASGKDLTNTTARLHTNFRLGSGGGYVGLLDPATNVVSEFLAYPGQRTDVSYGRVEGAPWAVGYFNKATPGAQNTITGPGFAPEVQFSRPGGTFLTPFALELATVPANAKVHYTLDGSVPTEASPTYEQPLAITNSLQVRVRAYATGLLPGPVRTEGYLLLHTNVAEFTSSLPLLVLHALGKGSVSASRATFAHYSLYEPIDGVTRLTQEPTRRGRSAIQIRGSSTEGYPKPSLKFELRDEFELDLDVELLGMPAESDWVLYAPNNFDPVLIHNPFVHQLSREMNRYSPRTRFVEVYLNRSTGAVSSTHYVGIYVLEEKIKITSDRVAIDRLEPEHLRAPEVTGGYLLKIDRLDPGDSGVSAGGATMGLVDPKEREIKSGARRPQMDYLRNYFGAFGKALSSASWRDPVVGYPAYVDVDAWIDFHVLEVLSGNVDALVLSTYFHKPRDGRIAFGPHWDFDRALGSTDGRDANPRMWNTGPFFSAAWWSRLFTDKDFWQKWVDRWQALRREQFSLAYINRTIDGLTNQVLEAQPREQKKWRVGLRRADGRAGGNYQTEVQWMKNWLSNRIDFIDRQLAPPPTLGSTGGLVTNGYEVTISVPTGGTVYYTVDGTDPRASQGNIATQATAYTGPIRITGNTRIVARSRDPNRKQSGGPPTASSTPWSGPVAATFVVNPLPLVVTELMFHPAPPPAGSTNTAEDFEFVELLNRGAGPLDLPGFKLGGGVGFTFAATNPVTRLGPGERVLVVRNRAAFESRYPGAFPIAGEYTGGLGNAGDRVVLTGPLEEPVVDFAYHDDWQPLSDGFGFSIVPVDEQVPAVHLGEAARWRLSAAVGGSPGQADPSPPPRPRVLVNEIVANPRPGGMDALELYNAETTPADISGWWLTDDFDEPWKYRIPAGTVLPAHGYWVFLGSELGAGPAGFGFSSLGDEACLFSADAGGTLTGAYHGIAFGPQEPGTGLARWITSDGREHFAFTRTPTLGHENLAPVAGELTITEVMYQPPPVNGADDVRHEFIELTDLSGGGTPLRLHDPDHPANTWRIRGGVDFDFPSGFRMPDARVVVIVGFDPERAPADLAGFRARYRLGTGVTILGPWRGALGNGGGTLRLLKPLAPLTSPAADAGTVPYVNVLEFAYGSAAPWPVDANGTGRSINLVFPEFFAAEPAVWASGPPTPGDLDSDADGLPDAWELSNGTNPYVAVGAHGPTGDRDGDGQTNWDEYLAGTSALDPASRLELGVWREPIGTVRIGFVSGPSRTYTLLTSPDAASATWQPLQSVVAPPQGGPVTLDIATPGDAARFYRLRAE